MRDKQGAAAIQQFLANQMGVSTRTIRRWLDYLEEKGALVRIPVAGRFVLTL